MNRTTKYHSGKCDCDMCREYEKGRLSVLKDLEEIMNKFLKEYGTLFPLEKLKVEITKEINEIEDLN